MDRKLVGIELEMDELEAELSGSGRRITTGVRWATSRTRCGPRASKNIGYVWVPIELSDPGTELDVETPDGFVKGRTATIPFVDPRKEVPAGSLRCPRPREAPKGCP